MQESTTMRCDALQLDAKPTLFPRRIYPPASSSQICTGKSSRGTSTLTGPPKLSAVPREKSLIGVRHVNVRPKNWPLSSNNGYQSVPRMCQPNRRFPTSRLALLPLRLRLLQALLPQHDQDRPRLLHDPAPLKHLFEVNRHPRKLPSTRPHSWWFNPVPPRTNGSSTTRFQSLRKYNWTLGSRISPWTPPSAKSWRRTWSKPKIGGINNPTQPTAPLKEPLST